MSGSLYGRLSEVSSESIVCQYLIDLVCGFLWRIIGVSYFPLLFFEDVAPRATVSWDHGDAASVHGFEDGEAIGFCGLC